MRPLDEAIRDLESIITALRSVGYALYEHRPSEKYTGGMALEIVRLPSGEGEEA